MGELYELLRSLDATALALVLGIPLALLLLFVWRMRLAVGRARAMKALMARYGLRDVRALGFLRLGGFPRLEGDIDGVFVRVMFISTDRYDATSFQLGVRAPAFGMAVVEARKDAGGKGLLGALVERRTVGSEPIPIPLPVVHEAFVARGQDPVGLARALGDPGVADVLMAMHREVKGVAIEWGLLKFYVDEILTDPDRIATLLERGVILAQRLDSAVFSLTAGPPGKGRGPG